MNKDVEFGSKNCEWSFFTPFLSLLHAHDHKYNANTEHVHKYNTNEHDREYNTNGHDRKYNTNTEHECTNAKHEYHMNKSTTRARTGTRTHRHTHKRAHPNDGPDKRSSTSRDHQQHHRLAALHVSFSPRHPRAHACRSKHLGRQSQERNTSPHTHADTHENGHSHRTNRTRSTKEFAHTYNDKLHCTTKLHAHIAH